MKTENLQQQKLIILGDAQCGKSSLINAMITGKSALNKSKTDSTDLIEYTIWKTENDVDFLIHDCSGTGLLIHVSNSFILA